MSEKPAGMYDPTNLKELKEMCKVLNEMDEVGADDGKFPTIKYTAVKKDVIVESFVALVDALDDAKVDIPEAAVNFYNDGITETPKVGKGKTPAAAKAPEKKALEKKAPVKDKLEKAAEKKAAAATNGLGHRLGSQAAAIDELVKKGTTLADAAAQCNTTPSRVKSHIGHLIKDKGVNVPCKDGIFKIKK